VVRDFLLEVSRAADEVGEGLPPERNRPSGSVRV
jgi:hypothetical protein